MLDIRYEKDIILYIDDNILQELYSCVNNAYPDEAFGLIFGNLVSEEREKGDFIYKNYCDKFDCIQSDVKSPISFFIEEIEKLDSKFKEASQNHNLRLVSIFHSHPSGSYPSSLDVKNMKILDREEVKPYKNRIWTIMDARNKKLNGFIYLKGKVQEINIIFI